MLISFFLMRQMELHLDYNFKNITFNFFGFELSLLKSSNVLNVGINDLLSCYLVVRK